MPMNGPKPEVSLITARRFPLSSQTVKESRGPEPRGLAKKTRTPSAAANWTQPSMLNEAGRNAGASGISTDWLTPSMEKPSPALPAENVAPFIRTPLVMPTVSRALLSARHHATIPGGGAALMNRAWTVLFVFINRAIGLLCVFVSPVHAWNEVGGSGVSVNVT